MLEILPYFLLVFDRVYVSDKGRVPALDHIFFAACHIMRAEVPFTSKYSILKDLILKLFKGIPLTAL